MSLKALRLILVRSALDMKKRLRVVEVVAYRNQPSRNAGRIIMSRRFRYKLPRLGAAAVYGRSMLFREVPPQRLSETLARLLALTWAP